VPVPSLPGLGTTWYERGTRYWLRRASGAFVWLLAMALFCFAAVSMYSGFREQLPAGIRPVWDWVQVAASFGTVVWGWLVQRRSHRAGLENPPPPGMTRSARQRQAKRIPGLAVAGRFLLVLAAPVLPAFAAFWVGWVIAAFTVREYPSEVGARQSMERARLRSSS
jgi:hypothetical protein